MRFTDRSPLRISDAPEIFSARDLCGFPVAFNTLFFAAFWAAVAIALLRIRKIITQNAGVDKGEQRKPLFNFRGVIVEEFGDQFLNKYDIVVTRFAKTNNCVMQSSCERTWGIHLPNSS